MRNKIKQKMMGAVAIAAALFMGISPMTAFAQSKAECTCDTKCTEECMNPDCEMCAEDIANCEGTESEQEPAEETFGPLTPDGNLSLVDDYGSIEAGGKQFITVVTKKGNYFYIIIDRDDQGDETVHFLNMVDESDLLALMDDEEAKAYVDSIAGSQTETLEPAVEKPTEESTEPETTVAEEPAKKSSSKTGLMVLILFGTVAGIGGFLYLKSSKKKPAKATGPDPDADYTDEEEDYLAGLEEEDDFEDEEIIEDFDEESEDDEE